MKEIRTEDTVHEVRHQSSRGHGYAKKRGQGQKPKQELIKNCKVCGRDHPKIKEKCFAWGKTCTKCKRKNHFQAKCTSRVHHVRDHQPSDDSETDGDEYHLLKVGSSAVTASLIVNMKKTKFQIDTGADVNTIGRRHVFTQQIKPTTRELLMWNGAKVKPLGQASLRTKNPRNGKVYDVLYTVVEDHNDAMMNLLGLETLQEMDLVEIKHKNFIAQMHQSPESIGDLGTASLTTDPDVTPRDIMYSRRRTARTELKTSISASGIPKNKPACYVYSPKC
ncbi:hypothetical protein ElyMa_002525500 [Elysia marginata]|uniref:Peptidase A2 domain-containing protein n=1 Tax=Elysia marginata TaxID=1093978 RepID=A0AAV4GT52_9GAST|nr:hypothetical protein ElyMa_002525500 [Elysia marginata]